MLLCTRFQGGAPETRAELLSEGQWHEVLGRKLLLKTDKPLFGHVCAKLTWFPRPRGVPVALCEHFLKAMNISTNAAAKRVRVMNRALKKDGLIELEQARFLPGKPAWVGSRTTLKRVHKFL